MFRRKTSLIWILCFFFLPGCQQAQMVLGRTWHQKCGWNAEEYFTDPQVVALCKAIEANELAEIKRLIDAGADVNAKGKGNMTPLLWAFPDAKLERFELLLKHNADPNVVVTSDFNSHGGIAVGTSVTHMSCKTEFDGYFDAVFDHGGDVNLTQTTKLVENETPVFTVIKGGAKDKLRMATKLAKLGANLSHQNSEGTTAPMTAVAWGQQYNIATVLLEAGADYKVYEKNELQRLIHIVARKRPLPESSPEHKAEFQTLVDWLGKRGEHLADADADLKRWASYCCEPKDIKKQMDREVKERLTKEKAAAEKEANNREERDVEPDE